MSMSSRVTGIMDVNRLAKAMERPGIDPRVWQCLAFVTAVNIDTEGPLVDVILMPERVPETARVGTEYAGPGFGFYVPIEVDDEVLVGYPCGDPDEGLVVLRRLWSKSDPPPAEAQADPSMVLLHAKEGATVKIKATGSGTVIIEAPNILAQSEGGTPKELAFKSDVQELANVVRTHVHPGVTSGMSSTTATVSVIPNPTGTSTLKAT